MNVDKEKFADGCLSWSIPGLLLLGVAAYIGYESIIKAGWISPPTGDNDDGRPALPGDQKSFNGEQELSTPSVFATTPDNSLESNYTESPGEGYRQTIGVDDYWCGILGHDLGQYPNSFRVWYGLYQNGVLREKPGSFLVQRPGQDFDPREWGAAENYNEPVGSVSCFALPE